MSRLLERAKSLHPQTRRWRRLLGSLGLTPDARELQPVGPRDFIVCGLPRSGTSLLAAQLYQPPASVTVMEPWDGLRMPPAELMRSLRIEMEAGQMRRGRLDVSSLRHDGSVRWGRDGEHPHAVSIDEETVVGVKWPTYWQFLGRLPSARFLVCVRAPVEVIESFRRTGGRLAEGLDYDIAFNRALNRSLSDATDDPSIRRALLYETIASAVARHQGDRNVLVVRYERWFEDPTRLMDEIADFLGASLRPHVARLDPRATRRPSDGLEELVARYCPSAGRLGYAVPVV